MNSKTLIGIVTYGNVEFTKLTVAAIRETTKSPFDLYIVLGKPDDGMTAAWLQNERIPTVRHAFNNGFPASINDIYDKAFVYGDYDNLIICGNDVIPYPQGIDALIRRASGSDWEWICSSQFDAQSLVDRYPEARQYFEGPELKFTDFTARPWEMHKDILPVGVDPNSIKDVRNLTLFKRSVFEKIGYADVNFWPGGYFEDNDYCRRALLAGVKACGLHHSAYFHFWSRTINQGPHATDDRRHVRFQRNEQFYKTKWGGPFGEETYATPFGGIPAEPECLTQGREIKIGDRELESQIIGFWSSNPGAAIV
jgi:GT2 family glycosyltransferase